MTDTTITIAIDGRAAEDGARKVKQSLGQISKEAKLAQTAMSSLKGSLIGIAAGFTLSRVVAETVEAQDAQIQLKTALQSSGREAELTTKKLDEMANKLDESTKLTGTEVTKMQSLIVQYRNVRGQAFEDTLRLAADVSARTGRDANQAAVAIAKALNDPAEALGSLTRMGIRFSQSQQNTIDNMVATGKSAAAQTAIINQLEKAYGGAAEAARNSLGGALVELRGVFNDLFEAVGVGQFADGLKQLTETVIKGIRAMYPAAQVVGSVLGGAFAAVNDLMLKTGEVLTWLAKPLGDTATAADVVVAALIGVSLAVSPWLTIGAAIVAASSYLYANTKTVLQWGASFTEAIATAKGSFADLYNGFRGTLDVMGTVFKSWITALVDSFMDAGRQIGDAFSQLPSRLMENAKSLFSGGGSKGTGDIFGQISIGDTIAKNFEIASAKINAAGAQAAGTDYLKQDAGALADFLSKAAGSATDLAREVQVTVPKMQDLSDVAGTTQANIDAAKKSMEQLRGDTASISRLRTELGLVNATTSQRSLELALLDRRNDLQKRGISLSSEQARIELQNVRTMEGLKEQLQQAEDARDRFLEPFKKGVQTIEDNLVSAFSRGKLSAKSFVDDLKGMMSSAAAEIARQLIFRPIISSVLNGISPTMASNMGYSMGNATGVAAGASSSGGISSLLSGASSIGSMLMNGLGLAPSTGIAGGLFSQGLAGIGNSIGTGLGLSAGGTATLTGAFGAMPYGALGGLGASLLGLGGGIGGTVGNIAGSLAGGAIGTSMGTILGMAGGPVGAIIGGFLGSALGGLFGNKKPTNAAAFGNVNFDTGVSSYSHMNKGNSAENMKILQTAFDQVKTFGQGFNMLGIGTVKGSISSIDAGVRDSGQAYVNGVRVTAAAGQFGQLAANALKEALRQTNITNSDVKSYLGRADYSDLGKLLDNVQFVANFRDAISSLRDGYNYESDVRKQAKSEIEQLNTQLSGFITKTSEVGLSVSDATSAARAYVDALVAGQDLTPDLNATEVAVRQLRARWDEMTTVLQTVGYTAQQAGQKIDIGFNNALANLRSSFNNSIEDQLLQMTNPQALALKQLDEWYADQRRSAVAVGGDLAKLEELYGLKRLQIAQQQQDGILAASKKAAEDIQSYLTGMYLKNDSSLSDTQRLQLAQQDFAASYNAAYQSKDSSLVSGVLSKGETLRSLMRGYYASGSDYSTFEAGYASMLQQLAGRIDLSSTGAGGSLAQIIPLNASASQNAIVAELQATRAQTGDAYSRMTDELDELNSQIATLNTKLERLTSGLAAAGGVR